MTSRLAQMQARFQQKQMQEKEEKLLKLYENQQQRTIERVSRGSAGSDGSGNGTVTSIPAGKVRQMFDERRQRAGIDRSYPLEPLKPVTRTNGLPRPANLDRNRNPTTRVKAATQKIDNYEENRYDLVTMMNHHDLNDNLDDEEMPNVEIDECDEPTFTGKLANVGGKLPSQSEKMPNGKISTTPTKIDAKPIAKKTILRNQTIPKRTSITASKSSSQSTTPKASTPNSPSKSIVMAARPRPQPPAPVASNANRAPSTNRPSARPAPRGPQSAVARDDLAACKYCNRRFASDRLQVHEDICARTGKKKRKTYDALKHRVQGTDLEPFVRKTQKAPSTRIPATHTETITIVRPKQSRQQSTKKGNWRQTHEEFISTIRAAKMAQVHIAKGGKLSDLPPPPPSSNPDYVQCPHCGRRFNETAAERHIPKCATYQFNKPKPPPSNRSVPNKMVSRGTTPR